MSQQKMITSFISTASVQNVSENVPKSISSENIESSRDVVFDERPPNVKLNPPKDFIHVYQVIPITAYVLKMN